MLKRHYLSKPELQVSHETIYKTLFMPSHKIFYKGTLTHIYALSVGKRSTNKGIYKGIIDAKTIHEKPYESKLIVRIQRVLLMALFVSSIPFLLHLKRHLHGVREWNCLIIKGLQQTP